MQRTKQIQLSVLIVVAIAIAAPQRVSASSPSPLPSHDQTHPGVMQITGNGVATAGVGNLAPFTPAAPPQAVGGAGGPVREIFGFGLASSLADPTVGYPSWDFSLLSTVAFFGLHVQNDGTFANDSGWSVWNSSQLTGLLNAAHSHGTKVVVTVILQDFSSNTPNMCSGLQHGSTTITNAVNEMKAKGVDGINVDYEGLNGSCGMADSSWARHAFTNFVASLRSAMPAGSYLSVDTYASAAADPFGFFDVTGLGASVDSFFVMAYDLEYSNYARAPLNCTSFCLGPTAPYTGYYYNDWTTAQQYTSAVPASKVILGVPYYGRKACVGSAAPNQYPTSSVVADTYLDASTEASSNLVQPGSYATHRDGNDPSGNERWDTWVNTQMNCTRELYWDDASSLAVKYALVNGDNLRGVGIWNLNYGGGAPELWSALNTAFSCQVGIGTPSSVSSTEFNLTLSAGSCSVASYDVQQFDNTTNQGWWNLPSAVPSNGSATEIVDGYPANTYTFQVRAHTTTGLVTAWSQSTVTVSPTATYAHPFKGLYSVDLYGGVNASSSPPLWLGAYWPTWTIARAGKAWPSANTPQSGFVLDGWGGLHPYGVSGLGEASSSASSHYWPGWDIARDFAFLPDGSGGFVLDGWGGLHAFRVNGNTAPLAAQTTAYWPGWDIARKVVIFPDGKGGYVMDAWGGLHPFGINGPPPVGQVTLTGYWPGWNIARDVVLVPGGSSHSGFVLDGWGGLHPFHATADPAPTSVTPGGYWPGWDIARAVWFLPGSATAGYTLDGWGGMHPFGGAPAVTSTAYRPGADLAHGLTGG